MFATNFLNGREQFVIFSIDFAPICHSGMRRNDRGYGLFCHFQFSFQAPAWNVFQKCAKKRKIYVHQQQTIIENPGIK